VGSGPTMRTGAGQTPVMARSWCGTTHGAVAAIVPFSYPPCNGGYPP